MLEDVGTEEELEDEGFEDADLDPTIELLDAPSCPSPATTSTVIIPNPTFLQATAGPSGPPSDFTTAALEQQLVIMPATFFFYHTVSVDFPVALDNLVLFLSYFLGFIVL